MLGLELKKIEDEPKDEIVEEETPELPPNYEFVIMTHDFSGLGFATKLIGEGKNTLLVYEMSEDEECPDEYDLVGQGMVDKMDIKEFMKKKNKFKDAYILFDMNKMSEYSEELRKGGFKVFGASALTAKMEDDRAFGTSLVIKAGLDVPETIEFSSIEEGVSFLEENEDKAYIFKPDEPQHPAWVTTVPIATKDERANEEIKKFLVSMSKYDGETYILQERKKGVEINVEYFVYKGTPFFAHGNFESKRKNNGDLGKMIGCAHDTEFILPLDCKILNETLAKLVNLPEFKDYTGFLDMNLIVGDNKYWFLEFCARFGYNSHPNLFHTLAISPLSEIMSDFIDGNVKNFYKHFRYGFGVSILLGIDDPIAGLPITIPEDMEKKFYPFDLYNHEGELCLAGFSNEVGIITAHAYDLCSAADEVLKNFDKINYTGMTGRTDIGQKNYDSNPQERLIACEAMKLFI